MLASTPSLQQLFAAIRANTARFAGLLGTLFVLAANAHAGTIALRTSAAHPGTGTITLAQVASLQGDDVQQWGEVVVEEDAARRFAGARLSAIELEDIRRALRAAGAPVGRLSLSGSACVVRVSEPRVEAGAPVQAPVVPEPDPFEPALIDEHDTLRARVAQRLAELHNCDPGSLRVRLAPADREYLDTLCGLDTVVVEPSSSAASPRPAVTVRVIRDSRVVSSRAMMIEIEVRRFVLVLLHEVHRGKVLSESDLTIEDRWMAPAPGGVLSDVASVAGGRAKSRLEAGRVLVPGDVDPPTVIKRGDLVLVLCYTSGIEVRNKARALAPGRVGDLIELKVDGGEKSFTAVVDAPGRAILDTRSTDSSHQPGARDGSSRP